MITNRTVEVTQHTTGHSLYLAPFGAAELANFLPVDPTTLPHESAISAKNLATLSPDEYIGRLAQRAHVRGFGLYAGEDGPQRFIGMISSADTHIGEGQYEPEVQIIGTIIFDVTARNIGYGTLAKMGILMGLFDADGNGEQHVFAAETSTQNTAAKNSLYKAGFTMIETTEPYARADGSTSPNEYWMLADAFGLEVLLPAEQEPCRQGLERYEAMAASITARTVS